MKTDLHSLQLFAAVLSIGTVMFVGCGGDDDDNATPSNAHGGSTAKGGDTGKGGSTGNEAGQTSNTSGGTGNDTGGTTASPQGGNSSSEGGAGGQPTTSEGGSTGNNNEGGSAGEAPVGPPPQPDCKASDLKGDPACYKDCAPVKTDDSKYFINHCGAPGVECTPFDNSTLTKLVNGKVPALPQQ